MDNNALRRIEKWLLVTIGILLVAPFVLVLGMWSWNAKELPFSAPSMEFVVERGDHGIQRVQADGIPEHVARMARGFHRCVALKLDPEFPASVILRQFQCASNIEEPPPVFFRLSWQPEAAPVLSRLSDSDALGAWNDGTEIPPVEYSISFGRAEAEALVEKCTSNARVAGVAQEFQAVFSRIAGPGALFGMEGPRLLISASPGERWMAIRKRTVTGSRRSYGFFSFDALAAC